jgi:hypothetical protein
MAWLALKPDSGPARAASPRPTTGRSAALQSLNTPPSPGSPAAPRGRSAAGISDPSLRLDLLAKVQGVKYEGAERNIFQFYTPPPPPPKPTVPVTTQPVPTGPPPPPPPPPIPLKFYGHAAQAPNSPRQAFLQDGDDIFVVSEGEVVKKRYKVLKINVTSIEMEDLQTGSKQRLALPET